jgi:hypothetical protein
LAAGGFFLGSTCCASAKSADIGSMIDTAGKNVSAGTKVPASSRLLSFMVIPGKRGVALQTRTLPKRQRQRKSDVNGKANL